MGETIAAISTAPGRGGVAVVRVSGDEAFDVVRRVTGKVPAPGRIALGKVRGDDCVLLAFKGPNSYTGEDVAEIQCHGGAIAPARALAACISAGARLARRGEFTERAFLNGKLPLEAAQGVLDLIDAKTDRAAENAIRGFAGEKTRRLRAIYDDALDISSSLEHVLDIDEGDLPDGFFAEMGNRIDALKASISTALKKIKEGKILREGALVVLAGAPNAGKSSLLNALLGENRAIVSAVAGTTRDSIEEWMDMNGWPVRLVDTAGVRSSDDEIEAEGIRRTEKLMDDAVLIVALGPGIDMERYGRKAILIHPKCDLGGENGKINVSSKTGEGLDELKRAIVARLEQICENNALPAEQGGADEADSAALYRALAFLDEAASAIDSVILANCVRSASSVIGERIGAEYAEDMLSRLFSRFCVGK